MHISIILSAITVAILVRLSWQRSSSTWANRWNQALSAFLFPPILLVITSLAVLSMGHHGKMFGLPVGWVGCHLALGFLAWAGGLVLYLVWQGWRSRQQMQTYPTVALNGTTGRVLETTTLFAAQVGLWRSEFVVTQGLLETLTPDQLEAVLSHEQAHFHYHDNFWFFGLGWVRRLTSGLPNTEALWQELLLLRELRADRWATQQVDALVLAESLLLVVRAALPLPQGSPLVEPQVSFAAFGDATSPSRLAERIESLVSQSQFSDDGSDSRRSLTWWLPLALLPLLTVPLHM